MKSNLKDNGLLRQLPGWFALLAVLSLGAGAAAYNEVHQKISVGEHDLVLVDKLNELARLHVLVGHTSKGNAPEVRQVLRMKIEEDLIEIKPLIAKSSRDATEYAQCVLAKIDHYEKTHPDNFPTFAPSTASFKSKAIETDRQVAVSKPVSH